MFVVVARWYVKEEKEDEIKDILRIMTGESRAEPGCIEYFPSQAQDDKRRFLIYEQYNDEAAFKSHIETRAFKDYVLDRAFSLLETRLREIYDTFD
jgi:quinol monooxygenase YgiN